MPSPYSLKNDRYSSHAHIAAQIKVKAAARTVNRYAVLDIGCAAGFLRHFLPAPDFYLMGVEYNPELAAQARGLYDQVYQADLGSVTKFPLPRKPNAVVFGDVLEHFANPETILSSVLKRNVESGTQVIISLPNFANLYVRLNLLLGRFEYAERGILDHTHLRFFTLKTARQLCAKCRIHVTSVGATPIPLPLVYPIFGEGKILFPLHMINAGLASAFKTLLAYQFIIAGFYEP